MFIETETSDARRESKDRSAIGWIGLGALALGALSLGALGFSGALPAGSALTGGALALGGTGLLAAQRRQRSSLSAGRNRWSRRTARLAGCAMLIAACLLGAETVVRYVYSDVTRTPERDSWFSRRWLDENPLQFNRLGFREREFPAVPEPGTVRVAVMGDSLTFGEGVRVEERFTNILSEHLAHSGNRFEILNFGRSGASLRDHVDTLEREVIPARPKVVLLQWYVDDVRLGPPPALGDSRLVPSQSLHRFLHRHSASYFLLERWWRRSGRGSDPEADSPYSRAIPTSEAVLREHAQRLRTFVATVRAHGAIPQIVLFPPLVEVRGRPDRYPHGEGMKRVLAVCAETAINCLDLREVYAQVEPASALWANRLFIHPGARANALAAEAIAERLATRWPTD